MPILDGTYHRIRTYPSGKKMRLTISGSGRILEAVPVMRRIGRTRTGQRLAARRRRIR
jgi:hypothetical protein